MSWLGKLHLEFGVTYQRCCSKFEFDDSGFLLEQTLSDNEQIFREEELGQSSLIAQFSTDSFTYSMGFVRKSQFTYALMEISDKSLDRMTPSFGEREVDFMTYLVMVGRALESVAMVVGLDCSFEVLTSFIDGALSQSDVKQNIIAASQCNDISMGLLRACGGKDVIISNSALVARWLPGS